MGLRRLILLCCVLAVSAASARPKYYRPTDNYLGLGFHGSNTFLYPTIEYQRAISAHFAVGLLGLWSNTNQAAVNVTVYGGLGTLGYYSGRSLTGLWLQGGYGYYVFKTKLAPDSESFNRTPWIATIGYRGRFERYFSIGLALGVIHVAPLNSKLVDIGLKNTAPMGVVDLGLRF